MTNPFPLFPLICQVFGLYTEAALTLASVIKRVPKHFLRKDSLKRPDNPS